MKAPKRLQSLIEEGLVDSVVRQLMSGKEAAVYVVPLRAGGGTRLAGARAVIAAALGDRVQLAVAGIERDVAMAVVEARAEREVDVERAAVGDAALRTAEAARGEAGRAVDQAGDVLVLQVVVVLIEAVLGVEADAFEIVVHDEVDDAGDGVGAVHRGGAAGQHFDTVDEQGRHGVDVRIRRRRVARDQPAAVDQHEGPVGAEAAKVDRGGAEAPLARLPPWPAKAAAAR